MKTVHGDRMKAYQDKDPLKVFAQTSAGRRRRNDDAYLVMRSVEGGVPLASYIDTGTLKRKFVPQWSHEHVRAVLIDGVGGHKDPVTAINAAIDRLLVIPPQDSPDAMAEVVMELHRWLFEAFATGSHLDPGFALLIADISLRSRMATMAHVGDCRAYRLDQNTAERLTHDHTPVEFKWRDGQISDDEYAVLTQEKQVIAQAMAYGPGRPFSGNEDEHGPGIDQRKAKIRIDVQGHAGVLHADAMRLNLARGEYLLLATDGLNYGSDQFLSIINGMGVSQSTVNELIRLAFSSGSEDNITLVLCG
jgi:serine/threonine protein phosphatase PrpC